MADPRVDLWANSARTFFTIINNYMRDNEMEEATKKKLGIVNDNMNSLITEIKRPASESKELEPTVTPTRDSLSKKTLSKKSKGKKVST